MSEKPTTLQLLAEEANRKQELAQRILTQMGPDHKADKLSDQTMSQVRLGIDNFEACILRIREEDAEKAIYFFSRGCWNLGEAMGRSKVENPRGKECLPPESTS